MRKLAALFFAFSTLILLSNHIARADVVNPDYLTKKCNVGESEVTCSYKSTQPFGPITSDECGKYKNNPNYKLLVSEGHSFGGSNRYCYKADFVQHSSSIIYRTGPFLIGTLVIELIVFFIFGFRTKKELLQVILVNIVSVFTFAVVGTSVSMTFQSVLIAEALIVVFEAFVLYKLTHKSLKRVIIATVLANLLSATLGSYLVLIILANLFPNWLVAVFTN